MHFWQHGGFHLSRLNLLYLYSRDVCTDISAAVICFTALLFIISTAVDIVCCCYYWILLDIRLDCVLFNTNPVCVNHRVKLLPCHCRQCNRQSGVVNVVNELYIGAFQQFYTIWRTQHKTIADSGFVLAGDWYVAWLDSVIKAENRNVFVGMFSPIPRPFPSFSLTLPSFPSPSLPALKWPLNRATEFGGVLLASPSGRKRHLQPPSTFSRL